MKNGMQYLYYLINRDMELYYKLNVTFSKGACFTAKLGEKIEIVPLP